MSGIAVFNKAISTLQDSQRNLQAVSMARQKLEREKERLDLEKKKGEVQLEGMRLDNATKKSDMEFAKKSMDSRLKLFEMALEQQGMMIDNEEEKQKGIMDESMNTAKTVAKTNPYILAPYMTGKGDIGIRPMKQGSSSGQSFIEKDVLAEARAMAKEDYSEGSYESKMKKYIPVARKMLMGQNDVEEMPESNANGIDAKTEARIQKDMKFYKKSREEIIAAYKKKNLI